MRMGLVCEMRKGMVSRSSSYKGNGGGGQISTTSETLFKNFGFDSEGDGVAEWL